LVVPFDENRIAPKRIAPNDLYSDLAIHDSGGLWISEPGAVATGSTVKSKRSEK